MIRKYVYLIDYIESEEKSLTFIYMNLLSRYLVYTIGKEITHCPLRYGFFLILFQCTQVFPLPLLPCCPSIISINVKNIKNIILKNIKKPL